MGWCTVPGFTDQRAWVHMWGLISITQGQASNLKSKLQQKLAPDPAGLLTMSLSRARTSKGIPWLLMKGILLICTSSLLSQNQNRALQYKISNTAPGPGLLKLRLSWFLNICICLVSGEAIEHGKLRWRIWLGTCNSKEKPPLVPATAGDHHILENYCHELHLSMWSDYVSVKKKTIVI